VTTDLAAAVAAAIIDAQTDATEAGDPASADAEIAELLALLDDPDEMAAALGDDGLAESLLEAGFTGEITTANGSKRKYVDGKQVKLSKGADKPADKGTDKGVATQVSDAVKSRVNAVLAKVPESIQAPLANAYHAMHSTLMAGNHAAKALALETAKGRGASPEQVERLGRILGAVDLVAPTALGIGVGSVAGPVAGKLTMYAPVGSMSYIAYSTARDPAATLAAAGKLLKEKFPEKVRGAWQFAVGAIAKPLTRQQMHEAIMESLGADVAAQLLDRLDAAGDRADMYEALFAVALDETGDPAEAMAMADEAFNAGGRQ
jgi:hypothetical protein